MDAQAFAKRGIDRGCGGVEEGVIRCYPVSELPLVDDVVVAAGTGVAFETVLDVLVTDNPRCAISPLARFIKQCLGAADVIDVAVRVDDRVNGGVRPFGASI